MNDDSRLDCSDMEQGSDMQRLSGLAEQLAEKEQKVEKLTLELKAAQKDVQDLAEGTIPELMEDLGFTSFTTASGFEISVEKHVHASITEENKSRAYRWFDENGCGGMIKRSVIVAFNRDQADSAKALAADLREKFPAVKEDLSVHHSTLKAWVKRRREEGEAVPDSISVHEVNIAKVTK